MAEIVRTRLCFEPHNELFDDARRALDEEGHVGDHPGTHVEQHLLCFPERQAMGGKHCVAISVSSSRARGCSVDNYLQLT